MIGTLALMALVAKRRRLLLPLLLLTAGGALAHHSAAMFNNGETLPLTGTVREFQWANPHCYIQLLVRGEAGADEEWSIEMGAPMYLIGQGWKKSTLKPGDRISVTVHPLNNGGKGGLIVTATAADGRTLGGSP